MTTNAIKAIDRSSVHRITSGQVVVDLQTAVKELVENSLDAGATNIEVRFVQHGLKTIQVIDNGSGVAEDFHDNIALKHYTSKLVSFSDLSTVRTFGFRGEALSSLCAVAESVSVITATEPPMGTSLEMEPSGRVSKRSKVARQRGTTVTITNLFASLPVRRKELERNSKREFGKALSLLNAYALGPCCTVGTGVRLTVTNQMDKGQKNVQISTTGATSPRAAVSALWGTKALENIVDLEMSFNVDKEKTALKRVQAPLDDNGVSVSVKGLVSKFTVGAGRTGTDRQFFYVNGRPCHLPKIQKTFNEVYRSFNATQSPFILADFIIPTESCDINVSPDKRTIFLHSEGSLLAKLKVALEDAFAPARSTYDLIQQGSAQSSLTQTTLTPCHSSGSGTTATRRHGQDEEEEPTSSTSSNRRRGSHSSPVPGLGEEVEEAGVDEHHPNPPPLFAPGHDDTGAGLPSEDKLDDHVRSPSRSLMERDGDEDSHDKMDVDGKEPPPPCSLPPIASLRTDEEEEDEDKEEEEVEVEGEGGDENDGVVKLDTRRAGWNRDIEMEKGRAGDESQDKDRAKPVEQHDQDEKGEDDTQEPARKKRRSEVPTMTGGRGRGAGGAPPRTASGTRQRTLGEWAKSTALERGRGRADKGADEGVGTSSQLEKPRGRTAEGEPPSASPPTTDPTFADDEVDEPDLPPIFVPARDLEPATFLRADDAVTVSRPEVIRGDRAGDEDVSLRVDVDKWLRGGCRTRDDVGEIGNGEGGSARQQVPLDASVVNTSDGERAADALARVIEKEDFAGMAREVVGQFNLGFVVVRRRKVDGGGVIMDDLFIVDQHAADEKYNFEALQETTKIRSQRLFRPQPMELTASDEIVAMENLDVLRQNGFEVEVDESEGSQGSRLKLTAQPISKSTVFDMKDLEELIHLMHDRPTGQMVRCSKARAMFAMRACRKSVMVGMPLKKHQMALVVEHMGTMDQPWNCPHGRPTMRHLVDIANLQTLRRREKTVDWTKTLEDI